MKKYYYVYLEAHDSKEVSEFLEKHSKEGYKLVSYCVTAFGNINNHFVIMENYIIDTSEG